MSTGKRLAKRSILGTRVCAPRRDGLYMCGVIQSTKSDLDEQQNNVYCVYFDDKTIGEYSAMDLVGPGFRTILDVVLQAGQTVYLTHNGREVRGIVLNHRPDTDDVELRLVGPAVVNLKKRLDELRLIESRKSARLQDSDTDYSRMVEGDYNSRLPEPRRRASSLSIDVPYGQSGRKRRSSADDGVMDDCMAAMVLMSLSCSPKSPCNGTNTGIFPSWGTAGLASSSGASSYSSGGSGSTRATPSPPSHILMTATTSTHPESSSSYHQQQQQDEGIDVDDSDTSSTFAGEDSFPAAKRKSPLRTRVVFQCTWPGCGKLYQHCDEVERHVRTVHLRRMDLDDPDDHEEEFYYTEIEVDSYVVGQMEPPSPETPEQLQGSPPMPSIYSSSVPTLSHLDMARPAHEDPEYRKLQQQQQQQQTNIQISSPTYLTTAAPISIPQLQKPAAWHLHGYAASAPSTMGSPQKCMRLSPKPLSSPSKTSSPLHSSRKTRSESRKCRKVYGMDNRDMWCTQCKWKKACTRFVD